MPGSPTDREATRRVELDAGERDRYRGQIESSARPDSLVVLAERDTTPGPAAPADDLFIDQPTPVMALDDQISALAHEWHDPTEPTLDGVAEADEEPSRPTEPDPTWPTHPTRPITRAPSFPPPLPTEAFVDAGLPPAPLMELRSFSVPDWSDDLAEGAVAIPRRPVQRTGPAESAGGVGGQDAGLAPPDGHAWLRSAIAVGVGAALTLSLAVAGIKLYAHLRAEAWRPRVPVPLVASSGDALAEVSTPPAPVVSPLPPPDLRLPDTGGGSRPDASARAAAPTEAEPRASDGETPDLPELPALPEAFDATDEGRAARRQLAELRAARAYGEMERLLVALPPAARQHPVARLWLAGVHYQLGRLSAAAAGYQALASRPALRAEALLGLSRTKLAQNYRTLALRLAREARRAAGAAGAAGAGRSSARAHAIELQLARCLLALRDTESARR